MMISRISVFIFAWLFVSLISSADFLYAQDVVLKKIDDLKKIQQNITWMELEIEKRLASLTFGNNGENKKDVITFINQQKKRIANSELEFIELATGVNLPKEKIETEHVKKDILKELQDLLDPIISGLKRVSEKPRKIEKLRSDILDLENLLASRNTAVKEIQALLDTDDFKELYVPLKKALDSLNNQTSSYQIDLDTKHRLLEKELGEEKSVLQLTQELVSDFLKHKGKNLLYAIISFLVVFWIMIVLRKKVLNKALLKSQFGHFVKPVNAIYSVVSIAISLGAFVLALYLAHDWVLVTVTIFIITIIAWSFKSVIPMFLQEMRLALNLGTVREGERLIWSGIPWRVEKLGLYCTLKNDLLDGGVVSVPAREIMSLISRRFVDKEELFPCKKLDWILLEEKMFQVILLTSEQVVLKGANGLKHIGTTDFFSLSIENLSKGFSYFSVLGLDYGIQNRFLDQVLPMLRKKFAVEFLACPELSGMVSNLRVDFHSCAGSSLNIIVMMDCDGKIANLYKWIQRKGQEIFLKICNEENLVIPYEQLTVHLEK